jgi:hypothetical protein
LFMVQCLSRVVPVRRRFAGRTPYCTHQTSRRRSSPTNFLDDSHQNN